MAYSPLPVVEWVSSAAAAIPKSSTLTSPSLVSMTLLGFTSRWTMPSRWAASSASATAAVTRAASAGPSGPEASRAASVSPSSSSMTRNGAPPSLPKSNTRATLGWASRAVARASRTNRRVARSSAASSSTSSLSATRRPSTVSSACHTSPMPPVAIRRTRRYRPWGPSATGSATPLPS